MLTKTNITGFYKDTDKGFTINSDMNELEQYNQAKLKMKQNRMIIEEIEKIKKEIVIIKSMFQECLNRKQ